MKTTGRDIEMLGLLLLEFYGKYWGMGILEFYI